jgi:hypothetical protein
LGRRCARTRQDTRAGPQCPLEFLWPHPTRSAAGTPRQNFRIRSRSRAGSLSRSKLDAQSSQRSSQL